MPRGPALARRRVGEEGGGAMASYLLARTAYDAASVDELVRGPTGLYISAHLRQFTTL